MEVEAEVVARPQRDRQYDAAADQHRQRCSPVGLCHGVRSGSGIVAERLAAASAQSGSTMAVTAQAIDAREPFARLGDLPGLVMRTCLDLQSPRTNIE